MVFTLLMVLYVVLAVFLIGFILIQRGAGAAAGSGFGAGASATVFGARGASSFLTKATKWLAIAFFALTLGMAVYIQRTGLVGMSTADDLGVMSGVDAPGAETPPPAASDVPLAPPSAGPAGDAPATDVPAAQGPAIEPEAASDSPAVEPAEGDAAVDAPVPADDAVPAPAEDAEDDGRG